MLHDWRALPTPYRRHLIALKDRYDAIWQSTLGELHDQGLLRADAKLARLLILGAMNYSATWYCAKSRTSDRAGLDELAAQTVALVLRAP
jgi:hypothetical protein